MVAVGAADGGLEGADVGRVERQRAPRDVLSLEVTRHEVGGEGVPLRDEVRARRVEGVGEAAGHADDAPALRREHARAAVGEVLDPQEVLDLIAPAFQVGAELRFVTVDPVERAVESVDLLVRVEAWVGDDADRDRPRGERDQPDPVPLAHEVVRAELADAALLHAVEPALVVRSPLLDIEAAGESEPGRVDVVVDVLLESELALDDLRPAACVDHPSGRDGLGGVEAVERHHVPVLRELHSLHDAAVEEVRAGVAGAPRQLVLEATAVELVGGHRRQSHRAPLDPPRDVAVVARREEEAEARLLELVGVHVVLHADDVREVVRAQLDGRLPDLERRLRGGTLSLLGDEDRRLRARLLQLERERQPREPAAEDGDVVALLGDANALTDKRMRHSRVLLEFDACLASQLHVALSRLSLGYLSPRGTRAAPARSFPARPRSGSGPIL